SFPNVATYLDDQSGQVPGRNLDIYAADLERIEILEGPQGTLFGAGAQAGVIRYITNKPKLDRVEANVSASYATTAHGDPSSSTSSTTTGTFWCLSPIRTWTLRGCSGKKPTTGCTTCCRSCRCSCTARPTTRTSSPTPRGR